MSWGWRSEQLLTHSKINRNHPHWVHQKASSRLGKWGWGVGNEWVGCWLAPPVLWHVCTSPKALIRQWPSKVLLHCQQLESLSRLREAREHGREGCSPFSAVEGILSWVPGGQVSNAISATNSLRWPWLGDTLPFGGCFSPRKCIHCIR